MPDSPSSNGSGRPQLGKLLASGLTPPRPTQPAPPATPPPATPPPAAPPAEGGGAEAAADPGSAAVASVPGELPLGWEGIAQLRRRASEELETGQQEELPEEDRQQKAREVIARVVGQWATAWALEHPAPSKQQVLLLRETIFHQMFGSGALQRYLDDSAVENIKIYGDEVRVKFFDRPTRVVPPIAASDQGLLDWVNEMAARSGHRERQLAPARPETNFRLPDGSRVAATLLTPRPAVTIRRHRVLEYTLDDLTRWGTIDPVLREFITACVRGRKSILFAGNMGSGKTTLLRAAARTIPSEEDVATLETDRELYLEQLSGGPHVLPFEARESGGEHGRAGQRTLTDIFPEVLRHDISRVIVGEVRSTEVFPMLDSMAAGGDGGMCTLHARQPAGVLDRLLFLCNRAGLADDTAAKLIATAVDFVVYLRRFDDTARGGRQWRFVSHVLETAGLGESGRPAFNEIFAPGAGDPRGVPRQAPAALEELAAVGFDPGWLQQPRGQWQPMRREAG